MIKILKILEETDLMVSGHGIGVRAALISDTKAEVEDNSQIVGLTDGTELMFGSTLITTEGDFAIRDSSGEWVWHGDNEDSTRAVQSSVSPQLNISRGLTKGINAVDIDDEDDPFVEELRDDA